MAVRRLNITYSMLRRRYSQSAESAEKLITEHTAVSNDSLTPEIKLQTITPDCALWKSRPEDSPFPGDPFWAFYWPGGQAVSRFILDNKSEFKNKTIVDIGSGSGACAIAAALAGSTHVIANDIEPFTRHVIARNCRLNDVVVEYDGRNLIGTSLGDVTLCVLVGDMFYDVEFSNVLFKWLCRLVAEGNFVLIGDPGRHPFHGLKNLDEKFVLLKLAEFSVDQQTFYGFPTSCVWRLVRNKLRV